ncbi:hypothetical protein D9M68_872310 [compost metagenome]
MAWRAFELGDGNAVPIKTRPCQAIKDSRRCSIRGALAVCIFDAQQHLAATMLGIKPIEQGGPGSANM